MTSSSTLPYSTRIKQRELFCSFAIPVLFHWSRPVATTRQFCHYSVATSAATFAGQQSSNSDSAMIYCISHHKSLGVFLWWYTLLLQNPSIDLSSFFFCKCKAFPAWSILYKSTSGLHSSTNFWQANQNARNTYKFLTRSLHWHNKSQQSSEKKVGVKKYTFKLPCRHFCLEWLHNYLWDNVIPHRICHHNLASNHTAL